MKEEKKRRKEKKEDKKEKRNSEITPNVIKSNQSVSY